MSEWRPIDSAPRDTTRVMLFAPTRAFPEAVIVGWYSDRGKEWLSEPGMWQRNPTHWMPLPDTPTPEIAHLVERSEGV